MSRIFWPQDVCEIMGTVLNNGDGSIYLIENWIPDLVGNDERKRKTKAKGSRLCLAHVGIRNNKDCARLNRKLDSQSPDKRQAKIKE